MAKFTKLLLALDLSPVSESLATRVSEMCAEDINGLHVVHVLTNGLHDPSVLNQSPCDSHAQRMLDHTAMRVRDLLQRAGLTVPSDRIYLVHGEPAFQIKQLAEQLHADLVIVGSHSKEDDWMQLPGATTNCVIQGASSDVMAVKI